jgi:hypothetical protein
LNSSSVTEIIIYSLPMIEPLAVIHTLVGPEAGALVALEIQKMHAAAAAEREAAAGERPAPRTRAGVPATDRR